MSERYIDTMFCDDIRHEEGGKVSFMGVYGGELILPAFPATLAKLGISTKVVTPIAYPLHELTLRIMKDEEELQRIAVEREQLENGGKPLPASPSELLSYQFLLTISPLMLDGPCILRALVDTDEGVLRGMALRVVASSSGING